jgi:hypothetical protein
MADAQDDQTAGIDNTNNKQSPQVKEESTEAEVESEQPKDIGMSTYVNEDKKDETEPVAGDKTNIP